LHRCARRRSKRRETRPPVIVQLPRVRYGIGPYLASAAAERAAKQETQKLLAAERARVKELQEEKRKLSTKLK